MSVDQNLIWEKELKEDAEAIAEGITEFLVSRSKEESIGFCLFLCDMRLGKVQYISDLSQADALTMLSLWVNQRKQ